MDFKLILQIVGVVLGLLYLYLEYKANIWLWLVGLAMPAVHAILYLRAGLYADFGMEIYYVLAGLYGLVAWLLARGKAEDKNDSRGICRTPSRTAGVLFAVFVILHFGLYLFLSRLTDSTVPFWDSFTTALSVIAMWMLSKKYVEQWLVWLVVDAVTVGLYFYKGIPLTACLYVLYTVLAVVGYRK
ncbi:MAG: nicotinamide riboside transporter PnuC [Bacteroidales bacterium]|nr:nicotinamide riboside transporter PnuC [Bacteroidales bacterium]